MSLKLTYRQCMVLFGHDAARIDTMPDLECKLHVCDGLIMHRVAEINGHADATIIAILDESGPFDWREIIERAPMVLHAQAELPTVGKHNKKNAKRRAAKRIHQSAPPPAYE